MAGSFSKDSSLFEITVPVYNRGDSIFADLKGLGIDENKFENQEGFLILKDEGKENHQSANLLIKEVLKKLVEEMK